MEGYYLMPHPPIMIPEIGKGRENEIQNTLDSCKAIGKEISEQDIETIILVTPHGVLFRDGISIIEETSLNGNFGQFGTPDVQMSIEIDLQLTEAIINNTTEIHIPIIPLNKERAKSYNVEIELDHGAMVPLYFLQNKKQYKLVHITYGLLTPLELYRFGVAIRDAVQQLNKKAVFIASGDLSHRLNEEGTYGKQFDAQILEYLEDGNIEAIFSMDQTMIREAAECGLRSIYTMLGAMDGLSIEGNILSYEGTFGVGYGVVSFRTEEGDSYYPHFIHKGETEHRQRIHQGNMYTTLARKTLDCYFKHQDTPEPPEELKKIKHGVFVSLKQHGELRGCIGTILPTTENVGTEIIRNAIAAATEDPRFSPLRRDELVEVDLSVDILHEPEEATSEQLDPKTYGVIVTSGNKRGLLLPNLEGIDTVEHQLVIALEKGNISPTEDYTIQRFKVERFQEVDDE